MQNIQEPKYYKLNLSKIMSNPDLEQRKPSMNGWAFAILVIFVALIAGTIAYLNVETINKWIGNKPTEEQVDESAEEIQQEIIEDSVEIVENPSIEEYLQFKKDYIEQRRMEKVFMSMPDVIIIDILRQHGTALSIYDIVDIYESYPETYNATKSGARSQQYLDSLQGKNGEPDILPEPAPVDTVNTTMYLTTR